MSEPGNLVERLDGITPSSLREEIRALLAQREHIRKQADDIMTLGKLVYASETETWQERAEALRAARDEAVRALEEAREIIRPFAVGCSAHFNDWCPDDTPAWYDEGDEPGAEYKSAVTVGDFRAARSFLARATQPAGKEKG